MQEKLHLHVSKHEGMSSAAATPTGERVVKEYLVKMIVDAAACHELKDDAEVWLLGAGSNELDHIPVPDLPHYGNLLQRNMVVSELLSFSACS